MGNRGDITNEQWVRLKGLLPVTKSPRWCSSQDHRKILNSILWVLRTGASGSDMPERYGNWVTNYSRFRRWRKSGSWDKLFAELQATVNEREMLIGIFTLLTQRQFGPINKPPEQKRWCGGRGVRRRQGNVRPDSCGPTRRVTGHGVVTPQAPT